MLGLLAQVGPLNGNALSRRARDIIGDFWTLTRSQVYRELRTLEKNNYVHAGPLGPRSSRDISITEAGLAALDEWLNAASLEEVIRVPLLLTIRFGNDLAPERLRNVIDDFAQRHRTKASFYDHAEARLRASRSDRFELATVRFGQLFERAVSEWLSELPELIPSLAPNPSLDD